MNIIVCLDDRNGMLFNGRRQSRDRVLLQRISEKTKGQRLLMNAYSGKIFQEAGGTAEIYQCFLNKALPGDFCFVETEPLSEYRTKIEKLIIYRWNKVYPADMHFDLDLAEWRIAGTEEFAGLSHEKITEEIYIKADK